MTTRKSPNGKPYGKCGITSILVGVALLLFALPLLASDGLPLIDLSGETNRHVIVADGTETVYQGHPTTVMTADGRIIAVWCTPHGGWCGPAAE